ncbi:DGQHR domain-containing protein DpdB [Sorangium sp. So ce291]|uniref:DGQHR domain-containing protein DpdB n=1 Tax=Sorangium sp. So ce291 TaxID=3133294 RepID=UPI003F6226FC
MPRAAKKTTAHKGIIRRAVIRRRALRIMQDPERPLYLFSLRAEEILKIADISRIARDARGELLGYQRPEVRQHIRNIQAYLDGRQGGMLFPNSIILSLSSSVRFQRERGPEADDGLAHAGTIVIPIPGIDQPKPAWIVDGQQRAMALSRSQRNDFPVAVNAFVADDIATQREQFLLVNSTKPLPRGLITELLPDIDTTLPANLAIRRAPAVLCDLLNRDPKSPFFGLIRRASSTKAARKTEVLADTSVMQILQESLTTPSGCLFAYRNVATAQTDFTSIRKLLLMYWSAVRDTFPDAWGLPPTQSRLMHSAGLRAMGRLMDRVMGSIDIDASDARRRVLRELAPLTRVCCWTSGSWSDLGLRWNEVQNVPTHVRSLTDFLLRTYHDRSGVAR